MYKVLVVDDEPYMLEGWRSIIDWHAYGYELCATASDGEDALEAIKACAPDLIITDIQMPVINGLELIRIIREELHLQTKVVIVSGYSHFPYVKEAIRYQVDHYVLKPIVIEEIHELLESLREETEQRHRSHSEEAKATADAVSAAVTDVLKRGGMPAVETAERLLRVDGQTFCQLVLVEACRTVLSGEGGVQRKDAASETYANQLVEACLAEGLRVCRFEELPSRIGLLLLGIDATGSVIRDRLADVIKRISSTMADIRICVSGQSMGLSGLQNLYAQMLSTLDRPFIGMRAGVYFYHDNTSTSAEGNRWEDITDKSDALLRFVEKNDAAGIQSAVNDLFDMFARAASAPSGWLQVSISHIRSQLLRRLSETGGDADLIDKWISMYRSGSPESWTWSGEKLISLCTKAAAVIAEHRSGTDTCIVKKTLAFIESHFHEKIKLQDLAKQFSINPVYMGQQFKRETGYSFNDYMHKLRIDEAKKLLRRTDMKIAAIARQLGYHDTEYFTEKFKALTSCSPSSYKNQCKGELHATKREPVS